MACTAHLCQMIYSQNPILVENRIHLPYPSSKRATSFNHNYAFTVRAKCLLNVCNRFLILPPPLTIREEKINQEEHYGQDGKKGRK